MHAPVMQLTMPPPKKRPGRPKEPGSKRSQGVDRHTKPRIVFHLPREIYDALLALAADNRRTRSAEILIALEEHLRASGRFPKKEPQKE